MMSEKFAQVRQEAASRGVEFVDLKSLDLVLVVLIVLEGDSIFDSNGDQCASQIVSSIPIGEAVQLEENVLLVYARTYNTVGLVAIPNIDGL